MRRLLVGLLVLLFCAPFLWHLGVDVHYAWALSQALGGPLQYVEYQPNTDWPKHRISEPEKIRALRSWLRDTREDSAVRSDPPACVCEMKFAFQDGREVVIKHSPFREPVEDKGRDCRSDVRLFFRSHWRTGSTAALAEIMNPTESLPANY